jgi:organic radical activating enzyme|tara:strand:+ start:3739 stop:4482 length:744 start_codon:yes stop_codon:yes gene_type:complete
MVMAATIQEIFCSIQGEGPYVGVRQAFIRFQGCNLSCDYCDTPQVKENIKKCNVEISPGKKEFLQLKNPIDNEKVSNIIKNFGKIHSVALTGGEPLLQAEFIRDLKVKAPLFLETNMTLPNNAEKVKDKIRYVAGDFKLRNAFNDTDNYEKLKQATKKSYRILRNKKDRDCFCKIVIKSDDNVKEIIEDIKLVKKYISCLILQPLTPLNGPLEKPSMNCILDLQENITEIINDVRIIPQTHKIVGVL